MKDKFVYIATALECIDLIEDYTSGYTLESFLADRKTQDAVIRNLEVIGQALKDFGIEVLAEKVPQTPWSQVAGMRLGSEIGWDPLKTRSAQGRRRLALQVPVPVGRG